MSVQLEELFVKYVRSFLKANVDAELDAEVKRIYVKAVSSMTSAEVAIETFCDDLEEVVNDYNQRDDVGKSARLPTIQLVYPLSKLAVCRVCWRDIEDLQVFCTLDGKHKVHARCAVFAKNHPKKCPKCEQRRSDGKKPKKFNVGAPSGGNKRK